MYNVFFHDLVNATNSSKKLSRVPLVGETIAFAASNSFFLIKGVTFNAFDEQNEQYEFDVYAIPIQQSDWVHSLR
ncbi:hypothetical protein ACWOFO_05725 [Carnobacterium maltaromaticum]